MFTRPGSTAAPRSQLEDPLSLNMIVTEHGRRTRALENRLSFFLLAFHLGLYHCYCFTGAPSGSPHSPALGLAVTRAGLVA